MNLENYHAIDCTEGQEWTEAKAFIREKMKEACLEPIIYHY